MRRCPPTFKPLSRANNAAVTRHAHRSLVAAGQSKIFAIGPLADRHSPRVDISSASIWEASIKAGIGKLDIDTDAQVSEIINNGFKQLPITARHAAAVRHLPDLHRDPFDRILIAQAVCEPLRFLTADHLLRGYSELVEVI